MKYAIDREKQQECQEHFNNHLELLNKSMVLDVSVELILDDVGYRHIEHRKFEWNGLYKGGKFKLIMEET